MSRWMMSLSLLVAFLMSSLAEQASCGEIQLRSVLRAKSSVELGRLLEGQAKESRLRLICDAQLRSKRIPGACFELIANRTAPNLAWLEGLCIERAGASTDWRELKAVLPSKYLPAKCRIVVARREADLDYADQAERPADVFRRTF